MPLLGVLSMLCQNPNRCIPVQFFLHSGQQHDYDFPMLMDYTFLLPLKVLLTIQKNPPEDKTKQPAPSLFIVEKGILFFL